MRLALTQGGEGCAQSGEVAAARSLLGDLTERGNRDGVANEAPALDRSAGVGISITTWIGPLNPGPKPSASRS